MHPDDATLLEALDAGASALVRKSSGAEEIVSAVFRAAETLLAFSAAGLRGCAASSLRAQTDPTHGPGDRGSALLAEGSSVAQVGKQLYMSELTVKTHIAKIYDSLRRPQPGRCGHDGRSPGPGREPPATRPGPARRAEGR